MNLNQVTDSITPSTGTLSIPASIAVTVGSINGTIGGVTPTTGVFTTSTANSFIPNLSTVPTNGVYLPAANSVGISTNSTNRLTVDAIGNLGLAVTPSAWGGGEKAIDINTYGSISAATNDLCVTANSYYSTGLSSFVYKQTAPASQYYQVAGKHIFNVVASGTAGAALTFTPAMTVFNTGGVSIGNTTDKGASSLNVSGLIFPQQAATASAPAYVKGAIYFDTTLNKLRVGGATAWETITSV